MCFVLLAVLCGSSVRPAHAASDAATDATENFFSSQTHSTHTNNWALLVDTSRYWFNYRHVANTLSFYRTVKRLGIPDSNIILMLADDFACSPRNSYPGEIYGSKSRRVNLYGDDIEVDYRGYEVTPDSLLRVLTNRHSKGTPRSKRLLTDKNSNVLLYLTGHGGDEFLKFQDQHEILSKDLADALHQMKQKNRYNELLFIAETCQASTMAAKFYSPDIIAIGSSEKNENSLSHHNDETIGLSVIDRFTFHTLEFMENVDFRESVLGGANSHKYSAQAWFSSLTPQKVRSTAVPQLMNWKKRAMSDVRVTDFFGSAARVASASDTYRVLKTEGHSSSVFKSASAQAENKNIKVGRACVVGYRKAVERYAAVGEVLHGGENRGSRTRGRFVAAIGCFSFIPLVLAASRAYGR